MITASASKSDYKSIFQEQLIPALGLRDTWIELPEEVQNRYAWGYDKTTDAPIRVSQGILGDEAYGVKSSARDMLAFLDLQLGRSSVSHELRAAIKRTQEPQFRTSVFEQAMVWEAYPSLNDIASIVEGNGLEMIKNAKPTYPLESGSPGSDPLQSGDNDMRFLNKTGSTNGFGAYVAMVPRHQLGVVVLANRNFPNESRVRATTSLIHLLLSIKNEE